MSAKSNTLPHYFGDNVFYFLNETELKAAKLELEVELMMLEKEIAKIDSRIKEVRRNDD